MRKAIIIFFALLFQIALYSQEEITFSDTYVVEAEIVDYLQSMKCDCCSQSQRKKRRCYLYEVRITKVLFQQDKTVYKTKDALKSVKYIVSDFQLQDEGNSSITIFCMNSCSSIFLITNKMEKGVDIEIKNQDNNIANIVGLSQCKKFTFLQKVALLFGIRRENIFQKAENRNAEESNVLKNIRSFNEK